MNKNLSSYIVFCIFSLALIISGCGSKEKIPEHTAFKKIGPWYVAAILNPDPPGEKGNRLDIWVLDSVKLPLEGSKLTLEYFMPAMGSMPRMEGSGTTKEIGNGGYITSFDFQMGGSWNFNIIINNPAGNIALGGSITTGVKGFNYSGTWTEPNSNTSNSTVEISTLLLADTRVMLDISDRIREELALDRTDSLQTIITSFQSKVESVKETPDLSDAITSYLSNIETTLSDMNNQLLNSDLSELRGLFGELSKNLLSIISYIPELQSDWHLFSCPMADGYGKWIQKDSDSRNPYMGQKMLKCHSKEAWSELGENENHNVSDTNDENSQVEKHRDHSGHGHNSEIAYYTCSMHPSVKDQNPGTCPICSMDLMPVKKEELETGMILVDALRRQRIGVRTEKIKSSPLKSTIRAVGHVQYDESRIQDITLRVEAWVEKLNADRPGMFIGKNMPLATIYSPQLLAAQEEFLQMKKSENGTLAASARDRLHLLGLSKGQIDNLELRGKVENTISILSPISGHVVTKDVVVGGHLAPGKRLFQLAPLDAVWVEAEIFESDIPFIKKDMQANITLSQIPGTKFEGKVNFVYPYLEDKTRNGKIRIHLQNPEGKLRPGMYANVSLSLEKGEFLQVPVSAVVYTGPNRLVFVDQGEGRLVPKKIKIGRKYGEYFEVLSGLKEGDEVVTSGNFLVAAESRIRSAAMFWGGDQNE